MDLGSAQAVDDSDFSEITDNKFSILEPDKDFFLSLFKETRLTFAIIWAIVRSQATTNGLLAQVLQEHPELVGEDGSPTPDREAALQEAFVKGMDGAIIIDGREALWVALSDFFPEMRNVLSIIRDNHQRIMKEMEVSIIEAAPKIEEMVMKGMKERMDDALTELESDISLSTPSDVKHGTVSTLSSVSQKSSRFNGGRSHLENS